MKEEFSFLKARPEVSITLTRDFVTSITASVTAVTNVGPGLGDIVGPSGNFATLPDHAKLWLCIDMLFGRLEIMTILVLLTPAIWRR